MSEQLMTAAKTLARWCYNRGVDERVLGCCEQLLKAAVAQALGRPAPAHLEHALWQQAATLLRQRRDWDRDHQVTPPPARGVPALPRGGRGVPHPRRPALSRLRWPAAPQRRRRLLRHPSCDRPDGTGSHTALEHTAQMLGATLLAQPA